MASARGVAVAPGEITGVAFLQHLVAELPAAVYVCEAPSGVITLFNRRAVELWGRTPGSGDTDERFCGSFRLYRLDGSPMRHADTPMADALRTGRRHDQEVVIERPDGSRVVVRVNVAPFVDAGGRVVAAVNVFQDVTEQKRAEDALRLGEARYRAIVEDQPEPVCRFRPDGTFTFVNEAYCRFFGLPRERLISTRYAPVVHPEDLPRVEAVVRMLSARTPVATIENRVVHGDGSIRWTQWTNRALYDETGRLVEIQATGRDIDARKRAEHELQRHLATLELLYRLADVVGRARALNDVCQGAVDAIMAAAGADRASILLLDEAGVMRFRAWRGLSAGYRAAVEGHSPWPPDAVDPAPIAVEDVLAAPDLAPLREVITTEGIRALAFVPLVSQGRLRGKFMVYYDTPRAITAEQLRLAATIAHHVAFGVARAQAEAEIAGLLGRERAARAEADAARAEAERASQAKDEFLAMLGHELRNPLSVIVNALAVLDHTASPDDRTVHARRLIRRQASHLVHLLDDLLDVARISRGQIDLRREPVDLRAAVELAVEAQRHATGMRGQRVTVAMPDEAVAVAGDPVRLQQVVGNLLDNASKYTPGGGAIGIELRRAGGEAVLAVRDNGQGIPRDQLTTIFNPFTQVNPTVARTAGGLGIGLTLVKRLVELHGGAIEARSDGPGTGAEFVARLPLAADAPPAPESGQRSPRAVPAHRIVVIEDNDDAREALVTALRLEGHRVDAAATGRDGVEVVVRERPDLVLLDIGLPDVDGYAVCRELRRRVGRAVPVVALTGYGQPADRRRSAEAGFDAHLVKPVTIQDVLTLLAKEPEAYRAR